MSIKLNLLSSFSSSKGRAWSILSPIIICTPLFFATNEYSSGSRVIFILFLGIFALITDWLILRIEEKYGRIFISKVSLIVILTVYLLTVLFVVWGVLHLNFHIQSGLAAADVAIFEQSIWNTVHDNGILYSTIEGSSHFAIHASPILLVLVPVYHLFESTLLLYAVQTLSVVLTGALLYTIGKNYLSDMAALFICLAYILHPAVLASQLTFHETLFAPPFFLWAVLNSLNKKYGLYIISLTCLLSVNERMGLLVLGLGIVMFFVHDSKKWAAVSIILGTTGLFVSVWILSIFRMDSTVPMSYYYFRHLGLNPAEMVNTICANPLQVLRPIYSEAGPKLLLFYQLFGPFGFILPIASLWAIAIIPETAVNVLSSELNILSWHYVVIITGLLLGAIISIGRISYFRMDIPNISRRIAAIIFFNTVALWPMTLDPEILKIDFKRKAAMQCIVELVPDQAAVCADGGLLVYFPRRQQLYDIQLNSAQILFKCDYAVVDKRLKTESRDVIFNWRTHDVRIADWSVVFDSCEILLLKRSRP